MDDLPQHVFDDLVFKILVEVHAQHEKNQREHTKLLFWNRIFRTSRRSKRIAKLAAAIISTQLVAANISVVTIDGYSSRYDFLKSLKYLREAGKV